MKRMNSVFSKAFIVVMAMIGALTVQSCWDDDDNYYYYPEWLPNALVTAKTSVDNGFYLQLDDSTTLLPVNMKTSPFGDKEVRALVNFGEVNESSGIFNKAVHINWIDSILTKPIAANLGEKNDSVYGTDPVEIVNDWVTIAEDGYLTLRFRTIWGNTNQPHFVNLISTHNAENPYELEFRHNAYGDLNGRYADGLVAFKLDSLPDTQGKIVKLKLKWHSFSGEKTAEFDYCTRRSVNQENQQITAVRNQLSLK